ncbi:hypothetical protein [Paenarthrobacter sp. NPDC058040]
MPERTKDDASKVRARRLIRWLAWAYAGLSAALLLLAPVMRSESFSLFVAVTAVPIFGYAIATVGRMDLDSPAGNPVTNALFLILNVLWCFVFAWTILRVLLQAVWAVTSGFSSIRR